MIAKIRCPTLKVDSNSGPADTGSMAGRSHRLWYVAAFTVVSIAMINLIWWLYYNRTEQLMDGQLSRRLAAVAGAASYALDESTVEGLLNGDIEAYVTASDYLEKVRRADSLSELFVLDPTYAVLLSTSLEPDSFYFLRELNGRYVDSVLFLSFGDAVTTPSYPVGGLYLKSAFAPLYGADGLVQAALGVEADVDYFDALTDLRRNLYTATILSVAIGLAIGILFVFVQRRINMAERQIALTQTHSYMGRMVAVVSHEIKNPLQIIRASAERLVRKQPSDEASYVVEEVDRLNQIVTGYLNFAGQKSNQPIAESSTELSPADLVAGIQRHLQSNFPQDQITWLGGEIDPALRIVGYPRSLRQVLLNLLLNAAEACQGAGRPIRIGVTGTISGNLLELRVIDEGPGIPKPELRKIFEPFYTTRQSGSGLGLYLTRKIVVEMGGRIDIESQPGAGTSVRVSLPLTPTGS